MLTDLLPPDYDTSAVQPTTPARHAFLTAKEKEKLSKAPRDSITPLYRVFGGGVHTYLLCRLSDDQDTLWGYADIGAGLVEFGPMSLSEMELVRFKPLNLPFEKDRFWKNPKLTIPQIRVMRSLSQSEVTRVQEEVAP